MYNEERYLEGGVRARVEVVQMRGWTRGLWFDETGLTWIRPSPNLAEVGTAPVFPGSCLFEGTNISEGRGTERPFENIGAPWLDTAAVLAKVRGLRLPGISFSGVTFVPRQNQPGVTPKFEGEECRGIRLNVTDRNAFLPVATGVSLLWAIRTSHGDAFAWRPKSIDRLAGTPSLRNWVEAGRGPDSIIASWAEQVARFQTIRAKYLLYE
jgi:uncharacterized protein YbbC (DUF1343 family)